MMNILWDDEMNIKGILVMNNRWWGCNMRFCSEEVCFTSENDISNKEKIRLS